MPVTQQSANTRISDNYTGLANLKIINVDGTDFMDSYQGMVAAREHAAVKDRSLYTLSANDSAHIQTQTATSFTGHRKRSSVCRRLIHLLP